MQHDYFSSFTRPIKNFIYDVAVPIVGAKIPYLLLLFFSLFLLLFRKTKDLTKVREARATQWHVLHDYF